MSLSDAFASHESIYRSQVQHATFGHLHPKPRYKYRGFVLFSHTCFGDLAPLDYHFQGLDDSPWFAEDLHEFIGKFCERRNYKTRGKVFLFRGAYIKCKNGSFRFSGKIRRVSRAAMLRGMS